MFGLTGSINRSDGAQFRLYGLFGPKLIEVDMKKATEKGLVVPIQVLWCPVQLQYNPTANCHAAYKKHRGIWYNNIRNRLIAGAARSYSPGTQVLIMVETIKHAMALKHLLPEYLVVSSETPDLDRIRNAFRKGTLIKVISTAVWKEGIDIPNLSVLVNATGVKSEIANIQLTGRVSRPGIDKPCGIVHDFYDTWSKEFEHFSASRKKLYDKQGYRQMNIVPTELLKNIDNPHAVLQNTG
jgi:superfamily II DNA or RNA helicase